MDSSSPENLFGDRKKVLQGLIQGRESANQLRVILEKPLGDVKSSVAVDDRVTKILGSFTESVSILNCRPIEEVFDKIPANTGGNSPSSNGRKYDESEESSKSTSAFEEQRGCYKRRKSIQTLTKITPNLIDDGHAWKKYGQKDILNAKHPRNYYRCTDKFVQGCQATKQVQKTEEDPPMYQTTYYDTHTCHNLHKPPQTILDSTIPRDSSNSVLLSFCSTNYPNSKSNDEPNYPLVKWEYFQTQEPMKPSFYHNQSTATDHLFMLSDLMPFDTSGPMPVLSSESNHGGDVIPSSAVYSCTASTHDDSHSFDLFSELTTEDIDDKYDFHDVFGMLPNLTDEIVDGLLSSCDDKRTIVSATNHRRQNDAALLPLFNMDTHIHTSSPQPIALPDGGEIVQPESSEQNPSADFVAKNNSAYRKVRVATLTEGMDLVEGRSESPRSFSGSPHSEDSDLEFKAHEHKNGSRTRKSTVPQWTKQVQICSGTGLEVPDDGFCWRKYGQKDILGAKYPRGYYRCDHRHTQGCLATKQVQRSDEDPTVFEITYRGRHTCTSAEASHLAAPPSSPEKQEPNTALNIQLPQHHHQHSLDFQTGLRAMTEGLDTGDRLSVPSFYFGPRSHVEAKGSYRNDVMGNFSPSSMSPATSGTNNFSVPPPSEMTSTFGRNQAFQGLESEVTEIASGEEGMVRAMSEPRFKPNTKSEPSLSLIPPQPTRKLVKKMMWDHIVPASVMVNDKESVKVNNKASVKVNGKASVKMVDGLLSSCDDARTIVSATNHRRQNDAALLPLFNMDTYIHTSSPQPIALPDGGEIVQLESSEQNPSADFVAKNNSAYRSCVLVSNSENKNTSEVRKRPRGKYAVEIQVPVKKSCVSLGTFDTAEEAVRACDDSETVFRGAKAKLNFPTVEDKNRNAEIEKGNCNRSPSPSSTFESSSREGFKELGMDPANKGIYFDLWKFVGMKEVYKSKGKVWTRFYLVYDPGGTEGLRSLIAAMANYLEFDIYNLDLTSLSSLSDLMDKLASVVNRSLILIQDFDHCSGMLPGLNGTELTGSCLLEFVDGLLLSCGDERIIVFTTNSRDLHAAARQHPRNEDIYIHNSSPPPVALPDEVEIVDPPPVDEVEILDEGEIVDEGEITDEGEIVQLGLFKQNETEEAASSFKWAFRQEGLTKQSAAYPNPNTLVCAQPEIASTEVLSENMGRSEDTRNLSVSQEVFLEGHVSESRNLTFPACSDAAAPSQLVATILHTSLAIPHMMPNLTGGSSETFQLGGQSTQSIAYPNHNSLVLPQPQIAITRIRSENMGSSVDWRASQQEPFLELKTTYKDSMIKFQLPLTSGIIELKEEVATRLQLELDSFDMKYKDEEGDWILIPCNNEFMNCRQLFSSLVNQVIRLQVFDKDSMGLKIVQPESLGQKPLVDFDASINKEYHSGILVSNSKTNHMKEASKRQCMTESILSLVESMARISSTDFDALENRARLLRAHQSGPIVLTSEKKDMGEGLRRECLTECVLSLDDSTKQTSLLDFDAAENKAHLLRAYQSDPVVSVSTNKNRGEALKRECLEDLQQICGGRRNAAAERFGGFHTTDYLAWKSFKVVGTFCHIDWERQIKTQMWQESASSSPWPIGLPDGGNVVLLDPLEQSTKNVAHAANADLCPPTVSLPKKKMVRKSLKTKCRTMSLVYEDHRQHFGRKCEGAAKSLGATRIWMKHGINRISTVNHIYKPHGIHWWPFRLKWARTKGYSLGGERTFEVTSLSVDDILDSRLLFVHRPQFARSSAQTLALPDGGKIFGPIALSSSELAATSNRSHLVRRDHCSSTASHYEWKNTRETSDRQGIAQHFGCKYKDVGKRVGVNIPMFKSTCRQHQIYGLPCWIKNKANRICDQHGISLVRTVKSISRQHGIHRSAFRQVRQPQIAATAEVLSENMGSSKDRRNLLASQEEVILEGHVSESSHLNFPACSESSDAATPSQLVATILHTLPAIPHMIHHITGGSSETFQLGGQSTQSIAYPNHNSLVFPQPQIAITRIRSENMGSSVDWRASQQEPFLELKTTYKDSMIKFQLPLTSGIIELKEEVARRLKLELDSFDMKYKDEEGDWILIPCNNEFMNCRQLFSSLVNQVIRLQVFDKDSMGLKIVQPESLGQKPLVDFDATNNKEYHSGILVSNSKTNHMKEASKRLWMTESILSLVESTARISSTAFDALENRAHLLRAHQSGPIVLTSEKKDTGEGLRRECLTKCVLSLDDSTKQTSLLDFDAAENKTHPLRAYQSDPVVSISTNKNRGEALKRECLEDFQQICGGRRDAAAERFGVIYDPGFHTTDYLAWKSFKVVETFCHIDWERQIKTQMCQESASSSPWPIGLPDGGNVVLLDPLEQSTKNVALAAIADLCPPTVSLPKKKMVRKSFKTKCRTMSLVYEDHRQHFGRKCEGAAKSLGATRIWMKHGINRKCTVNHIYKPHGIHWWPFRQKWARRKGYSLGGERTFDVTSLSVDDILDSRLLFVHRPQYARSSPQTLVLPDGGKIVGPIALSSCELAAINNRAHLVRRNHCSSTTSHYEWKTTRETSDRQGIAQHFGFKYKDVGKRLDVNIPMFKSICRQHQIYGQPCWKKNNANSICEQHGISLVRIVKSIRRQHGIHRSAFRQSASSLHWPIGLPAGRHAVSLSKKIIVRKTFKRECRSISVSFEGHQQHFGSRCEGVANSPCANRICEQHGICLVPTVKCIHRQHGIHRSPFRQGNSFGWERPVEVVSVSTEEKLISRLQFLRMSLLGRSSLHPLALRSGSEFPGHIAFSASELTSTNNRAHPGRQDQCGSSASRFEKERTWETLYREGIASHVFSFEHLQQHSGSKHKNDAKTLGVCLSTFKCITRHHGIRRGPNLIRNNVWRSPDPHQEKNLSPMFKTLSTNCHITMENDMGCQNPEPNELLPDFVEDLNFWNGENGSLAEIEKTPTFHDSFSGNCCEADICLSGYDETQAAGGSFEWPFQLKGLTMQFTANPYLNTLVFPHPQIAPTEVLSENMGSSEDKTKLLASQAKGVLEGHVSESSNLTFPLEGQSMQATAYPNHNTLQLPQPQLALTQILNEDMESSEDWIASQQEPFLEGHVSGSINSTVPTCLGASPSQQPMPTTSYTMHRILDMIASSVKLKATYRDTIIEFQLPLASGIVELKEEVAKILKLKLDSFDVKYKDEEGEGEGDWILIPCNKDLRNYLQLFSSLVNPVIRLLVVDKEANLVNLDPMALKQPATFVESRIDPYSNGVISDLLRFVSKKEICKKAGKAWTRFYLLNEPPGADRSSLIAAMANYLEFDICYLDLRSISSIPELKNMLLSTPNRSLIAIQDIDRSAGMLPTLKNELTVSCLLKYVDGLFSSCGDERIIVFTTNHRDQNDAALLPLSNMDFYIPASSPQPIALPDGGEIVQLESSEQKPLVDFEATNNRECHSGVLVSSSKTNNKREASKRLLMTESVLSLVDPTTGISLTEFDAPNNGAHLMRACQGGPIMSNSEKKDTGEGLKGDFLTKNVLSLDVSTKQKSLPDCDATENKAHLLIAYQSGPIVSLLENRNRGEASKKECITKSILGLEDLQQHSGGRRDNAAKSFAAIYDPGIHTTDSLARKSFEVIETLRPREQPSNATETEREREIWTQMGLEQSNARGAHSIQVNTYAGRFRALLFLSLCHSVCIRSIFWEPPDDFVRLLSLRRLTLKGCVRKEKSPYLPRLLQIIAVEPGQTKSPRYSGRSFAKSGTCLHWSDGLPDGGQVVSLSEKEIVRKTLKRKCRTTKVRRLEYYQLHFDCRCQDAAKRHGAKRICRQHVINQVSTVKCVHRQHGIHWWPFRQKWATTKVYSLEGKRPLEVISLSTGRKLVSRLQVIHVSWLGRSSPGSSAIPGRGGEIVGLIALSSSGFAAPNNRANLVRQNPSGSTASHSNKKRRRDAAVGKGINFEISEQDLRQHFGRTREEAANRLGVSVATLKRKCRKHGITRWCNQIESSDIPGRPPDPDERNTYPTCKASTHGQTEMVGHLPNPNEVSPNFFDDVIAGLLETPTSHDACAGNNLDMEFTVSSFLEESEASGSYEGAFEPQEQVTVSFAYPTHNYPVCAQPHIASKEMASENTRSSDLTSQVEARLEGHGFGSSYLTVPISSNPDSSQPVSTISATRPTVPQHISTIPGIGPSQVEARLEWHGFGSSYLTAPTSSNPASSQPVSTISETGPTIPEHISTIPGIGPSQVEAHLEAHGSGSSYLTVLSSSNPASSQPVSTIPETGPTVSQPMSTLPGIGPTIPHIMPPSTALQDTRLVTIKAMYRDHTIKFKLPLTSGLNELNEKVAMRLKLKLDSFELEYKDEDDWIWISCDEDLRDYLDNPVKLLVIDKVVNADESFKRKRP